MIMDIKVNQEKLLLAIIHQLLIFYLKLQAAHV